MVALGTIALTWTLGLAPCQAAQVKRYDRGLRLEELTNFSAPPTRDELEAWVRILEDPRELRHVASTWPELAAEVFAVLKAFTDEQDGTHYGEVSARADFPFTVQGVEGDPLLAGLAHLTWTSNGCSEWQELTRGDQRLRPGEDCLWERGWSLNGWGGIATRGVDPTLGSSGGLAPTGGLGISGVSGHMGGMLALAFAPSVIAVPKADAPEGNYTLRWSVGPTVLASVFLRGATRPGWVEGRVSFGAIWLGEPLPIVEAAVVSTLYRTRFGPRIAVRWTPGHTLPVVELGLEARLQTGRLSAQGGSR